MMFIMYIIPVQATLTHYSLSDNCSASYNLTYTVIEAVCDLTLSLDIIIINI